MQRLVASWRLSWGSARFGHPKFTFGPVQNTIEGFRRKEQIALRSACWQMMTAKAEQPVQFRASLCHPQEELNRPERIAVLFFPDGVSSTTSTGVAFFATQRSGSLCEGKPLGENR